MPFALTQLAGFAAAKVTFLPTDVAGATLLAWYDETTMTLSGSDLTSWTNRSGTLPTLASAGAADPATATDAGINGKRAITFNGTNNYVQTTAFGAVTQAFHGFMVFNQVTWTNNDILVHKNDNVLTNRIRQEGSTPEVKQSSGGAGGGNTISPVIGTWYLLETLWNGASSTQILGSGAAASGHNPGTDSIDRLTIGAFDDGTLPANLKIADFVIFDGEVTGNDLTGLRSYFTDTYGVVTN